MSSLDDFACAKLDRLAARSLKRTQAGYLLAAIRPPAVPEGTARLRFTFTAGHDDTEVERLAEALSGLVAAAA